MTKKQIIKAFEGRWRIKQHVFSADDHVQGEIKALCLDFFKTGILLGEKTETVVSFSDLDLSTIVDVDVEVNGFNFFWNAYEKKVGRPKCEKLWAKLTLKEKKACLDYIPLYKQAQPDKQYRKNPETFLRNKSWNDELIYRNGNNESTTEQQRINKLADILTD